jgi:uncharacterized spore protein YtfJ
MTSRLVVSPSSGMSNQWPFILQATGSQDPSGAGQAAGALYQPLFPIIYHVPPTSVLLITLTAAEKVAQHLQLRTTRTSS